jgi:CRP-like cAMP-binding protein
MANSLMTTGSILQNIARHIQLDNEESIYFTSLISSRHIARKEIILEEGQACKKLWYVHSGAMRSYCLDKEGKESTIMFAVADWWVTDMYCFLNEKPAMMYIEAIEDSCIMELSKANFEKLLVDVPRFERFFRILMQNAYTREQLRIIENLSLTAEQRYESFLRKYPHIAITVTQKQIASYLGITPEFLSAVRKNLARK